MTVIETSRRLGSAERKVMRLQRRLWLAQLAMWPTVFVLAAAVVAGVVWVLRRKVDRQPGPPPAAIDPAGAPAL